MDYTKHIADTVDYIEDNLNTGVSASRHSGLLSVQKPADIQYIILYVCLRK